MLDFRFSLLIHLVPTAVCFALIALFHHLDKGGFQNFSNTYLLVKQINFGSLFVFSSNALSDDDGVHC